MRKGGLTTSRWIGLFGLIVAIGLAVPVFAQDTDPLTTLTREQITSLVELLGDAETAEAEERWADALDLYRQSEAIVALDPYRYRQATCLEELSEPVRALLLYRELSTSSDSDVARQSRTRVTVLENLAERLPTPIAITVSPGDALVFADGNEMGRASGGEIEIQLTPGSHDIEARRVGFLDQSLPFSVEAMTINALEISLDPDTGEGGPEPVAVAEESGGLSTATWVLGGTTVAILGTATVFGVMSLNSAQLEREYDLQAEGADRTIPDGYAEDATRSADIANVLFALGGLVAIATILAAVLSGGESDSDQDSARVQPFGTAGGFGLGLGLPF